MSSQFQDNYKICIYKGESNKSFSFECYGDRVNIITNKSFPIRENFSFPAYERECAIDGAKSPPINKEEFMIFMVKNFHCTKTSVLLYPNKIKEVIEHYHPTLISYPSDQCPEGYAQSMKLMKGEIADYLGGQLSDIVDVCVKDGSSLVL